MIGLRLPGRVRRVLRRVICLGVLVLSACGIKGPPRAPLEATAPAPEEVPDAGCCREPK